MSKRKTVNNDLERRRPTFIKIGLIASLAFALMAFEYTTYGPDLSYLGDMEMSFIDEELPPLPKRKEKVEQKKEKAKDPNKFVIDNTIPDPDPTPDPIPDPTPDPDPIFFDLDTIDEGFDIDTIPPEPFRRVESMPHFSSCSSISDEVKRARCTESGFIKHLSDHLRIPRDIYFSEKAFVTFVVDQHGEVNDVKLENKVSPSLEVEIKRVFALMPDLVPGKQRGIAVPVVYTMPVNVTIRP